MYLMHRFFDTKTDVNSYPRSLHRLSFQQLVHILHNQWISIKENAHLLDVADLFFLASLFQELIGKN